MEASLKKNIFLLLVLTFSSMTLGANSLYIKVASLTKSDALFAMQYELQEIGFKTYITEYNGWFRVYTGPFKSKYDAKLALKKIQKEISRDAYVTEIEFKDNKLVSTPLLKENEKVAQEATPSTPVAITTSVVYTQTSKQKRNPQVETEKKLRKEDLKSDFFIAISIGAAKYDINQNGTLPLDILMRSYGPSYGFEAGYYITKYTFMTLNYQRTDLRHSYFDAGFATLNYQFDKLGTLSPYAGLVVGTSKINWKRTPVSGASAPKSLYSAVGGFQVGGDIEIYGGLSTYMYYRYMMMDFNTLVSEGTSSSEIEHKAQEDFNLGLKYRF